MNNDNKLNIIKSHLFNFETQGERKVIEEFKPLESIFNNDKIISLKNLEDFIRYKSSSTRSRIVLYKLSKPRIIPDYIVFYKKDNSTIYVTGGYLNDRYVWLDDENSKDTVVCYSNMMKIRDFVRISSYYKLGIENIINFNGGII